jgi:hypothetical protein
VKIAFTVALSIGALAAAPSVALARGRAED